MDGRTTIGLGGILAAALGIGLFAGAGAAADAAVPKNQSPPAILGTAQDGSVLKADHGQWNSRSSVSYSYQWRRCLADGTGCVDVPKATDQVYTARSDDIAHTLRVAVTARNKSGAGSAVSAATAAVTALPAQAPHNTARPAISGSPVPGQVLTASPGTWTGATPIGLSYRWRRCDATGGTCTDTLVRAPLYKPSSGDANHALRVLVTATNAAGTSASLSDPSPMVARPGKPVNASPPTISGAPQEGNTLTGNRGTWSNNPTGYEYSWQRCNKKGHDCGGIGPRAHGTVYSLTGTDVGHTLRFRVTAKNAGGSTTAASAPTGLIAPAKKPKPAPPQNTSPPKISGTAQQGQTLKADRGSWTNNPTDYDYSWTRCDTTGAFCNDIAGARGTAYSLRLADVGHTLRFKVTARNAGGGSTAFSAATAVVAAAPVTKASPPVNTSPPTISGTVQEGKTLTGNAGTWTNSPTGYGYSWRRCNAKGSDCDGIGGAHSTTYTLTGADVGHRLRFKVTAKNADGSTAATSAPTADVKAAARPETSSPPTISGTPQEGRTLSGNRGSWTHNPTDYDYAWLRCDRNGGSCAAIGGARSATYTLTSADVGNTLRFRVTAKNSEGSTTATSVPSTVIQKAAPPPPPPRPNGCPAGGNPDQVANITAPARLLVDTLQSDPPVVTRGTFTLVVRFHVTSSCGGPVQGALVYATATPYNQFAIPPETATGADGWATLVFRRLRGFPVSRRQQLIAMFVRARKPGQSLLGGISTRRLVSVPVRLG